MISYIYIYIYMYLYPICAHTCDVQMHRLVLCRACLPHPKTPAEVRRSDKHAFKEFWWFAVARI